MLKIKPHGKQKLQQKSKLLGKRTFSKCLMCLHWFCGAELEKHLWKCKVKRPCLDRINVLEIKIEDGEELKKEVLHQIEIDVLGEIRMEIPSEVKIDVFDEIKTEGVDELKTSVQDEIRREVLNEIKAEVQD